MKKAIVLLSGGLDSTVSMAAAINDGYTIKMSLMFDYGQKAFKKEKDAAQKISKHYKIAFECIELPWLKNVTTSSLVNKNKKLPKVSEAELFDEKLAQENAKLVWTPNRNGVFLNIAACYAEKMGVDTLISGFDVEEAQTFPDNSRSFIDAINSSFYFSTLNHVRVKSYVAELNKKEIVGLGRHIRVPLNLIWSCYDGGKTPCGHCESCARCRRAFKENGLSWLT